MSDLTLIQIVFSRFEFIEISTFFSMNCKASRGANTRHGIVSPIYVTW